MLKKKIIIMGISKESFNAFFQTSKILIENDTEEKSGNISENEMESFDFDSMNW